MFRTLAHDPICNITPGSQQGRIVWMNVTVGWTRLRTALNRSHDLNSTHPAPHFATRSQVHAPGSEAGRNGFKEIARRPTRYKSVPKCGRWRHSAWGRRAVLLHVETRPSSHSATQTARFLILHTKGLASVSSCTAVVSVYKYKLLSLVAVTPFRPVNIWQSCVVTATFLGEFLLLIGNGQYLI